MVLRADDELRHSHDETFNWRESLYFNFSDPKNQIGGWIYLWVVPNKPLKSGMLVSFYRGITDTLGATDLAARSPGGVFRGDGGNWVYCHKQDFPELITADFDELELGGLCLRRRGQFDGYDLAFDRQGEASFRLKGEFTMRPWDYADGAFKTPPWVATNRYHRSWRVSGPIRVGEQHYEVRTTGDSDHSWGRRDMDEFAKHNFKMWSFQSPDGRNSVSAIEQGDGCYLGFVDCDGQSLGVRNIERGSEFSATGVQQRVRVTVTDTGGRVVDATLPEMFAAIGHREPGGAWGFEGAGVYQVDGWGDCSGICSFFWPPGTNPGARA
jgi:hypothetical protein